MTTACGLVGIISPDQSLDISDMLAAMRSLQHRGVHSWGIASISDGSIVGQTQDGLLPDQSVSVRPRPFRFAVGHVGYSAQQAAKDSDESGSGSKPTDDAEDNAQPVLVQSNRGEFAVAFNGRLGYLHMRDPETNEAQPVQDVLRVAAGVSHHPSDNWVEAIHDVSASCVAAYAVLFLTKDGMYYVRDVRGYRPLVMADITAYPADTRAGSCAYPPDNAQWRLVVVASESAACEVVHRRLSKRYPHLAITLKPRTVKSGVIGRVCLDGSWKEWAIQRHHRDTAPPEAVPPRGNLQAHPAPLQQRCALEAVHFMRGGGQFDELDIDYFREECGRQLARQDKHDRLALDFATALVVGCPRGGIAAGRGYAATACLPYSQVLRATTKVLRSSSSRDPNARVVRRRKDRPEIAVTDDLSGKTIVLVDDLIVRAKTIRRVVRMLREAGASQVHVRIASPAVRSNCIWGTMLPDMEDLFAGTDQPTAKRIDADSLRYLTVDCFENLVGRGFCQGCFFRPRQSHSAPLSPLASPIET